MSSPDCPPRPGRPAAAVGSWPEACVLSRVGILRMRRSTRLASRRQKGDQTWIFSDDFFLHKIFPTPRSAALGSGSPGNAKGASSSFSRPSSSRPLPRYCWRQRRLKVCSLFQRSCLCVCGSSFLCCKPSTPPPSGSSQLDCRHLVAGAGGHISPCPLKPFALLGPKPTFLCFSNQLPTGFS